MEILIRVAVELAGMLIMASICAYHASLFSRNIPHGKYFHALWLAAYLAFAVIMARLSACWLVFVALLFFRAAFYDLLINWIRGKPTWYLGAEAGTDRLWAKALFWHKAEIIVCIVIFAALQFLIL
jgi:hypothetical protein